MYSFSRAHQGRFVSAAPAGSGCLGAGAWTRGWLTHMTGHGVLADDWEMSWGQGPWASPTLCMGFATDLPVRLVWLPIVAGVQE